MFDGFMSSCLLKITIMRDTHVPTFVLWTKYGEQNDVGIYAAHLQDCQRDKSTDKLANVLTKMAITRPYW